ncbi:quinone oxidoreductase family protein [Falsibacillus albus]|uniref:NADPH:quinone oxidoreductase family protein n=1 Tax=Falsibacillus albus TaxID=2478915 RepID=A0A3L7JQX1_9BACI|nr:NADPH:quinone oxidoreductase family protein [Falsibacillus albus]RLQ93217.1 NADPH:quinone oxidoreductase family protein [Falsibacillus albus]
MKAVLVNEFGGPDRMVYGDIDKPSISGKEILIKVEAASVNYADIKARYGKKGMKGSFPFIPGIDAAGVVEEVGADVKAFSEGDRVIAFPKSGSYAEYAVADEVLTYKIPEEIDFGTAAASPIVSFLSYKLIVDIGRMKKGETVLIHAAAGGVGTTAVQLAKLLGAEKVIGTVGSDSKIAFALEAGADHVFTYEGFAEKVNDLTDGEGVDIILDSISGEVSELSLECLAPYGRLIHFGNSSGQIGNFQTNDFHASCRSVLGFSLGTTRSKRPELLRDTAEKVLQLLASGDLQIKIGQTFPLEKAAEAHKWVESRQSVGKVLLKV